MDKYRVISATDPGACERELNKLAQQGYRFVGTACPGDSGGCTIVMEYDGLPGGRAGTVESEVLQASTPSQSPAAERQTLEPLV